MSRPPNEREQQIAADYLRGDKIADISERHGIGERQIRRIRDKLKLPARLPGLDHEKTLRKRRADIGNP